RKTPLKAPLASTRKTLRSAPRSLCQVDGDKPCAQDAAVDAVITINVAMTRDMPASPTGAIDHIALILVVVTGHDEFEGGLEAKNTPRRRGFMPRRVSLRLGRGWDKPSPLVTHPPGLVEDL